MSTSGGRRLYPKGQARQEEILEKAREVFRTSGFDGTSMREVAAACGLSQAGLLHHFPTKESLLLSLVSRRDDQVQSEYDEQPPVHWAAEATRIAEMNLQNLEDMHLWQRMGAEAIDPDNPAHDYFVQRYSSVITDMGDWMRSTTPDSSDAENRLRAHLLVAMWDGLNFQQLLLPEFDMRAAFAFALDMLQRSQA